MGFTDIAIWQTDKKLKSIQDSLFILLFVLLFGIWTTVPSESLRAGIFIFMLLWVVISQMRNESVSFGRNISNFYIYVSVGIFLATIVSLIPNKLLSIAVPQVMSVVGSFAFFSTLYAVIAAPILEEMFFTGTLLVQLSKHFNEIKLPYADLLARGITIVAFGGFHLLAYSGSAAFIVSAMIFRFLMIEIASRTQNLGFPIGLHIGNNVLAVIK